jgi:hypothetical protein
MCREWVVTYIRLVENREGGFTCYFDLLSEVGEGLQFEEDGEKGEYNLLKREHALSISISEGIKDSGKHARRQRFWKSSLY